MQLQVHGCLKVPLWILAISLVSYRNVMRNERAARFIRVAIKKNGLANRLFHLRNWNKLEPNDMSLLPI